MTTDIVIVIVLTSLGTFSLRYIPMLLYDREKIGARNGPWKAVLTATGPASIATLFIVSVLGRVSGAAAPQQLGAVLALIIAAAVHRIVGGLVAPTLGGAMIYAACVTYGAPIEDIVSLMRIGG